MGLYLLEGTGSLRKVASGHEATIAFFNHKRHPRSLVLALSQCSALLLFLHGSRAVARYGGASYRELKR